MKNQQLVYSRDEVVSALTSFYEFLVGLHLPSSALKYPPPGGWPNVTPKKLAFLEKNETVVDLLRHIPYIGLDNNHPFQIYEKTSAVDYSGEDCEKWTTYNNPDPIQETTTLPPHVVTLANTGGGRDGYYFFLDTERGTITRCDFQDGPEPTELSEVSRLGVKPPFRLALKKRCL